MDADLAALIVAVVAAAVSLVALVLGALNRRQDRREQQREREIRGELALDDAFDSYLEWIRSRTASSWRALDVHLDRAAQLLPDDDLRLVRYRAYCATEVGDVAEALSLLEAVADKSGAGGQYWLDLAAARASAGEPDEASIHDALARAQQDRRYAATAIVQRARRLRFQGQLDDALSLLAEAESLQRRNTSVHRLSAECLMDRARRGVDTEQSVAAARYALVRAIEQAPTEDVGDLIGDLAATYSPFELGAVRPPTEADLWMNDQLLDLAANAGSFDARSWRTATTADAARRAIHDRASAAVHVARALDGWRSGEHPRYMFDAIHDTLRKAAPFISEGS